MNDTPAGGRIVWGNTPLGLFTVEWDADGNLVRHKMEKRDPTIEPRPADAELEQLMKDGFV